MARTAVVLGGGIGGLATAIGLIRSGWEVTVFERSAGLPETGTGLGIWPTALRALGELGVGQQARAAGRRQPSGAIRRPDGSVIARIDVGKVERKHGEPVYLLSRPALLNVLAQALPAGVVRFGEEVTNVDGLAQRYDLVVGAEGIHSPLRLAMFGDRYGLRYSGMTAWRGVADLDIEAGGETWGRGVKFGVTPQEPGRTNWYAAITAPEGLAQADLFKIFGSWHDPIPRLLKESAEAGTLHHDLHYLDPPLPSFVKGNAVLVGDAAHAMTPDLGQGGCQALIDAAALGRCMESAQIPAGLAAYDRLRRRPVQRMAAMAARVNRLTQWRWTGLRDVIAKAALSIGPPG
jgi:2-polyprenyl-6-methoxyphenol hydroxylase-like FAD-dependent oxidoreductase